MSPLATIGLAFCTSVCYVTASYFMKMTSASAMWVLMPIGLAALLVGGLFEVEVMKTSRMGTAFIFILCFEAILVTLCAVMILGESYTVRELAGLAVIVTGIAVLSWPATNTREANADEIASRPDATILPADTLPGLVPAITGGAER